MNSTKNILIVDDNHDLADGVATILEMDGYITDVVYSGKKAVSKLIDGQFDLALVDIKMPDISGLQVFTECRDIVNTKFVFMTGFRIEQILSEIYEEYTVSIIRMDKPVDEVLSEVFDGGGRNIKIVIGDNILTNDQISAYCNNSNIKIISINGDEIPEIPSDSEYIILDLNNPLINSVVLVDNIKNTISNGVNIIILINNTLNYSGNSPMSSFSMTGCLFKPVNPDIILSTVKNIFEFHKSSKAGVYL